MPSLRGTATAWPVLLLFLVSGASGLVLEVVALERLGRVFGASAPAAAATLAAFFLGLGLGAWWGGRRAPRLPRPLRTYGLLELGAAGLALLLLGLAPLENLLYGTLVPGLGHEAGRTVLRLLLALLALAPAAACLGATFPVLVEHLVRRGGRLGATGALLYATNTIGAVGGALLAGLLLPPAIGYDATLLCAVAASATVGLLALVVDLRPTGAPPPVAPSGEAPVRVPASLTALAFLSGLLALGLEVLWLRAFALALPASVVVFTLVLVVYLAGLALGGGLAHVQARRTSDPRRTLVRLLAAAAVLVALTPLLFEISTAGLRPPAPDLAWSAYVGGLLRDATLILLGPVALLGAVFPFLLRVAERDPLARGDVAGRLTAWNTLGAVVGPLLAGFVVLETLGLWLGVLLAAFAYALTAWVVARRASRRTRLLAGLALAAVGVLVPLRPQTVRLRPGETLLSLAEGAAGSVAVTEDAGVRRLLFDNVFTLGGTHDVRWEALQAHLPLCLHPQPRRVFFLGLGTGITAGAAVEHPVEEIVVAELVPEVIDAAERFFGPWTNGLFADARVRVVADDARHALAQDRRLYDVIVGDLFFPWQPGTASLYTREHLTSVRERLAPGGHFAQWLPCYQLSEREVSGILATFVDVFEQVTLWRGDFFASRPILAVVGHRETSPLDPGSLVANASRLALGDGADFARDAATIPFHLYVANLTSARRLLAEVPTLTDDRPWLQWTAPRSERRHRRPDADLLTAQRLLAFETLLRAEVPAADDAYLVRLEDASRTFVEAGLELRRMGVESAAMNNVGYLRALAAYMRLVPAAVRPPVEAWVE